jgi:superfamily II DNA or RNA helicase
MATALVKIFQEDLHVETLILCPKNLERMWQYHVEMYGLRAKVLPISRVLTDLEDLRRYRLVLIDESHNLRNREGKRYRAIHEYIETNESRCILLSATPYNKTYLDLSNQLRLFIDPENDLGIRPELLIRDIGIIEFNARYENLPPRSLAAFEKSEYADDWRELMRLFMVRRTRSFIKDNYALEDERGRYLVYADGRKSYFPTRHPRRLAFEENEQYKRLYSEQVVDAINNLNLPRYGLGEYEKDRHVKAPTTGEQKVLVDLSRGGRRLMGFCRTNLFKRLESSGHAFILSVERHIMRNYVYLHALESGLDLPIGPQDSALLDTRFKDDDVILDDDSNEEPLAGETALERIQPQLFKERAANIYELYSSQFQSRFRWLRADLFKRTLKRDLRQDVENLLTILKVIGEWTPKQDAKLDALEQLLMQDRPDEKVLIFSQFADTVNYLEAELNERAVSGTVVGVTGGHPDPTYAAWRFSPVANEKRDAIDPEEEIRVLIATDVLSEGQNLQDGYVVINYDLPWAIIRLIQRAGRVDRIGQESEDIYCYSMWPTEGIETLINLRGRLRQRLGENAEVVGADEMFFEDEDEHQALEDLYNERSGILDDDEDREVDLVSHAYQIWKNATEANPAVKKTVERLPPVVYSAKEHELQPNQPEGVLVYLQTALGYGVLNWIDQQGQSVSQSQFDILRAAACDVNEPAQERSENHHHLVEKSVSSVMEEQRTAGVQLGRASGARFKVYERLKNYSLLFQNSLLSEIDDVRILNQALEQMSRNRLRESAKDRLNRQLRSGIMDEQLARIVATLYEEDKLCVVHDE